MTRCLIAYLIGASLLSGRLAGLPPHPLTKKQAEVLVMNVPEALSAKDQGACLMAESSQLGEGALLFQLRNRCARSGTGLIGNYVVDLRSGRVWRDIDRQHEVDSKRLRRVREQFRAKPARKAG